MVEVVFGASEADSLKMSRLTGREEEIICLDLGLDVGEIRNLDDESKRSNALKTLFCDGTKAGERIWKEYEERISRYGAMPEKLRKHAAEGKPVRIWYGRAPYEVCGYYYTCYLLNDLTDQISAVKLPDVLFLHETNMPYEVLMMGEIVYEEFPSLLAYEKPLNEWEIHIGAMHWERLMQENAVLRASVNGKVMSVQESFYDFMIEKALTEKPKKESEILGMVLGEYGVGIRDGWLAHRIEVEIRKETIRIVKDDKNPFDRWICKK